jgi:hypothetical protein
MLSHLDAGAPPLSAVFATQLGRANTSVFTGGQIATRVCMYVNMFHEETTVTASFSRELGRVRPGRPLPRGDEIDLHPRFRRPRRRTARKNQRFKAVGRLLHSYKFSEKYKNILRFADKLSVSRISCQKVAYVTSEFVASCALRQFLALRAASSLEVRSHPEPPQRCHFPCSRVRPATSFSASSRYRPTH